MSRFINPVPQYLLKDGTLASSGRMKFFVNGDYSTLKDTFSQSDNTVENTNPVKLDGSGRMPPCFGEGLYSVKFYAYEPNEIDGLGELQWARDDVSLSELTGQFNDWNPVVSYSVGDIVKASDGFYYKSFTGTNKGNTPTLSPQAWEQIVFIGVYNENRTYALGEVVSANGYLYRSNTGGNIGHTPPAAQWDNLTFNNSIAGTFTASGGVVVGNTPNASPTVLDYYQEGTFTPTVQGSTVPGTATYTNQIGRYTRIGNRVFFTIAIDYSLHTGTGLTLIYGLPFSAAYLGVYNGFTSIPTGAGYKCEPRITAGSAVISLFRSDNGALTNINMSAIAFINISGSFEV